MGYYRHGGGTIRFKDGSDLDGAILQHVKDTMFTAAALDQNANGGRSPKSGDPFVDKWYSWVDTKTCLEATQLITVIRQFLEESSQDETDPLTFYLSESNKMGQEQDLFEVLAPFIEPNTNVEWTGEDDSHWRWKFTGDVLIVQDGVVSYED